MQRLHAEIKTLPVVRPDQHIADFPTGVAFIKQITQRVKIAQRFGHLFPFHHQVCTVHPVTDKRFSGCRFTLSDLILMMREHVVHAPGMEVKTLPQEFHAHR